MNAITISVVGATSGVDRDELRSIVACIKLDGTASSWGRRINNLGSRVTGGSRGGAIICAFSERPGIGINVKGLVANAVLDTITVAVFGTAILVDETALFGALLLQRSASAIAIEIEMVGEDREKRR